jgi:hypothetical protein
MAKRVLPAGTGRMLISSLAIAGLAVTAESRAEDTEGEALAREAKMLMEQKRYSEACPKLAERFRRAPSGQGILELAQCQKEEGRLAAAWYSAREAVDFAVRDGRASRAKVARDLVKELEPRVPRLTVAVALKASSIPGLVVKRDEMPIRAQEWGEARPVDPGAHTITAAAPGYKTLRYTVKLEGDGATETVTITDLDPVVPAGAPSKSSGADNAGSTWGAQRTAGVVIGSVGVTALGAGAFAALSAADARSDAMAHCTGATCDDTGEELRKKGTTLSNLAALSLIGGGIATASGIAVFMTAPTEKERRRQTGVTTVTVSPSGAWVKGQF